MLRLVTLTSLILLILGLILGSAHAEEKRVALLELKGSLKRGSNEDS
jgi:hypothetical protein